MANPKRPWQKLDMIVSWALISGYSGTPRFNGMFIFYHLQFMSLARSGEWALEPHNDEMRAKMPSVSYKSVSPRCRYAEFSCESPLD